MITCETCSLSKLCNPIVYSQAVFALEEINNGFYNNTTELLEDNSQISKQAIDAVKSCQLGKYAAECSKIEIQL